MFIVFDLDGTLADDTHRAHFLDQEPRDWDAYFAACEDDVVIEPMAALFRMLNSAYDFDGRKDDVGNPNLVVIWTGRPGLYRKETLEWLEKHDLLPDALRMWADGDFRPDTEVKGEWLAECGDIRPDLIFDDRTKSVAFWREQGITCLQVAQHDY